YFTSLGDSYAARTGRPDNVGVIGVALFKRKYEPPRYYEQPYSNYERERRDGPMREKSEAAPSASAQDSVAGGLTKRAAPSAPLGTGHGRRKESQATYAEFQRATSYPVETITIY